MKPEKKITEKIDKLFESEQMRAITRLMIVSPSYLTKRGQSLGSMCLTKLIDNGVELPTPK